jgi:hypothetical protein
MEAVATQGSSSKVCSAFALTGEQATQGVLETEKRGVWGLGGESPSVLGGKFISSWLFVVK